MACDKHVCALKRSLDIVLSLVFPPRALRRPIEHRFDRSIDGQNDVTNYKVDRNESTFNDGTFF